MDIYYNFKQITFTYFYLLYFHYEYLFIPFCENIRKISHK